MNKKFQAILQNLGLTENEASIYLSNLALGPATILAISKATGIRRTSVYPTVELLKQKGLMRIEVTGFKQKYVAEDPARLPLLLEEKQNQIKNILPELEALHNLGGTESSLKYYEGLSAIKGIYLELLSELKPNDFYLVTENISSWYALDRDFFEQFIEKRAKIKFNLDVRLLLQDSQEAQDHIRFSKNFNVKDKLLPVGTELTTSSIVTPKKVIIHQLTPPVSAIVIENKSVVQMHKQTFEIIWNNISDISKN